MKKLWRILGISGVMAGFENIEEMLDELQGGNILTSGIPEKFGVDVSDYVLLRKLPSYLSVVNEYGCWCYFWEDFGEGKGRPVDEVDIKCKGLHHGYECAIEDTREQVAEMQARGEDTAHLEECMNEPWNVKYNSRGWIFWDDYYQGCVNANPDNECHQKICSIETYFVTELFSVWSSDRVHSTHKHKNGFNPSTECALKTGLMFEMQCCGDYPVRFKYRKMDSYGFTRECCGSYPYTPHFKDCCDDGFPRPTGTCNVEETRKKRQIEKQEKKIKIKKEMQASGSIMNKQGYMTIEISQNQFKRGDKDVKPRMTTRDLPANGKTGKTNKKHRGHIKFSSKAGNGNVKIKSVTGKKNKKSDKQQGKHLKIVSQKDTTTL